MMTNNPTLPHLNSNMYKNQKTPIRKQARNARENLIDTFLPAQQAAVDVLGTIIVDFSQFAQQVAILGVPISYEK